jgi:cytochrome c553
MNKQSLALIVSLTLLAWGNTLYAEADTTQLKTSACLQCHDNEDNNTTLQAPNLAGQNSLYLTKQIKLFRDNTRTHPILSSDEVKLDSTEIENIATHYQNLESQILVSSLSKEGGSMYEPCAGCHGSNGEGIAPFPRLIGQKPDYLEQQLINFKTGARQNLVMQAMTINLSDEDIKLLAAYLGGSPKLANATVTSNIASLQYE